MVLWLNYASNSPPSNCYAPCAPLLIRVVPTLDLQPCTTVSTLLLPLRTAGPAAARMSTPIRPMSAQLSPHSAPPARPRRPASASCAGLLPPDAFLGPAMGKVTVYEQRAKLLFELDRAAQRAGQQRTLAQQLSHTAETTGDEVAHLRGLLQDLERRHKLGLGHEAGGLDSGARIPWRPPSANQVAQTPAAGRLGKGRRYTPVINRYPERFGKPGDDPTLDCTFQPRIRPASHKILNEANCQQVGLAAAAAAAAAADDDDDDDGDACMRVCVCTRARVRALYFHSTEVHRKDIAHALTDGSQGRSVIAGTGSSMLDHLICTRAKFVSVFGSLTLENLQLYSRNGVTAMRFIAGV
eukprot:1157215-Pelagomonas_calceolata.AAC.1